MATGTGRVAAGTKSTTIISTSTSNSTPKKHWYQIDSSESADTYNKDTKVYLHNSFSKASQRSRYTDAYEETPAVDYFQQRHQNESKDYDGALRKHTNQGLVVPALRQSSSKSSLHKSYEHARPRFVAALDLSRNTSEPDSLIDLYKYRKAIDQTPISPNFPLTPSTPNFSRMAHGTSVTEDAEAKWIHRDKLTQIEIQEYRDRGMQPPEELLTRAAARGVAAQSRQARYPDNDYDDSVRQQIRSPDFSPYSPIDQDDEDEPFVPEDPRSPEEIAEEFYTNEGASHSMGKLRASSSKIPLATSSPLPIPVEHLERDTPLRRKRGTSDDWEDDTPQLRMRSRGNSFGSQVLLDDEPFSDTGTPQMSPTKNRNLASKVRTPVNTSKLVNGKQRTSSAARVVSGARPVTRNGPNDRPRTAVSRPEGEPPWMDQMWKPDPMLPPDQQMLPTHAKRMQAEQWQREGKTGSVYDRDFTPVQVYNENKKPGPEVKEEPQPRLQIQTLQPSGQQSQFQPSNDSQWPLKPSNTLEVPPKSPNTEHAGYSTMPKVQRTPSNGPLASPRLPRPEQQLELEPEKKENKKERGGCACCVVM